MDDLREKVIKGLECCGGISSAFECPYQGSEGCENCRGNIYLDALTLLKAQEPKLVTDIAEAMLGYRPKVKVGHCPSCGVLMSETDRFCRKCGKAVKWE